MQTYTSVSKLAFNKYDRDHSGTIETKEFKDLCYDLGHYLSDEEISMAMLILDRDGSGTISYDEFLGWWRSSDKWGMLKLPDEELEILKRAATYFKYFDTDKSGSIDKNEFPRLYEDLVKNRFTNKTLQACLEELDTNRDNKVQFNEYVDWLVRIGSIKLSNWSQ